MRSMPKKYEYGYVGDLVSDYMKEMRKNSKSMMKTDITETNDGYIMEIETPGILKENIDINFKDGYLTVVCNNKQETKDDSEKVIRKERYRGTYQRSFYLGDDYSLDDIQAKYENGELLININKNVINKDEVKTKVNIE